MFDYNAIRRDLAGARVQWTNLQLRMNHSWFAAGGDARLGYFNRTDFPASGVGVPANAGTLGVHNFARGQQRSLSQNALNGIIGGSGFTGISIGNAQSTTNLQRYVVFDGGTGGTAPALIVNFSKVV
jgi:hypothetical protein